MVKGIPMGWVQGVLWGPTRWLPSSHEDLYYRGLYHAIWIKFVRVTGGIGKPSAEGQCWSRVLKGLESREAVDIIYYHHSRFSFEFLSVSGHCSCLTTIRTVCLGAFCIFITTIIYLCVVVILGFQIIIRCHGYLLYFLCNGCTQYVWKYSYISKLLVATLLKSVWQIYTKK